MWVDMNENEIKTLTPEEEKALGEITNKFSQYLVNERFPNMERDLLIQERKKTALEIDQLYEDLVKQFGGRRSVPLVEITGAFFGITDIDTANKKYKDSKLFQVSRASSKSPYIADLKSYAKYHYDVFINPKRQ